MFCKCGGGSCLQLEQQRVHHHDWSTVRNATSQVEAESIQILSISFYPSMKKAELVSGAYVTNPVHISSLRVVLSGGLSRDPLFLVGLIRCAIPLQSESLELWERTYVGRCQLQTKRPMWRQLTSSPGLGWTRSHFHSGICIPIADILCSLFLTRILPKDVANKKQQQTNF